MLVTFPAQVFLSTNLVNQILSAQSVRCAFPVIREVFANAVDHHHYESAVIYVQPVAAADEFIIVVLLERIQSKGAALGRGCWCVHDEERRLPAKPRPPAPSPAVPVFGSGLVDKIVP